MNLKDSIDSIGGIMQTTKLSLNKLGIYTVEDLLFHLPIRIEDRSRLMKINSLKPEEEVVIEGEVTSLATRKTKNNILMVTARIDDGTGKVSAVWFNQRFVLSQLNKGEKIMLFGTKKIAPSIGNPFIVKKIISRAGFYSIYPTTQGLYQGHIANAIKKVLPLAEEIEDLLPPEIREKYNLISRKEAITQVHAPKSTEDLEQAKDLLGFEELLGLAISIEKQKKQQKLRKIEQIQIDREYLKEFSSKLPFKLTDNQRQAAWNIIKNMSVTHPTSQLLYGEVGSGKTIVSLLAGLAVARSGKRVLILVPTIGLASQQANNIQKLVGDNMKIGLLTSSSKESDNADIVVGTHALLHQADSFTDIGLIIIDEQQRFGVKQRQKLLEHHPESHLLMTTATPIPRSLAQTIMGNLTIIYLMDKPLHQKKIESKRFNEKTRPKVISDIKERIARGESGYVICPAISTSPDETLFQDDKKAVLAQAQTLKRALPGARIEILHGKLSAEQKTKTLDKFLSGQIDVLVATTVVEVGIDKPEATWMIIENAEMFGLSTLHQLRGRVGRGSKSSVCYLSQTTSDERAEQRLQLLETSDNGLALAEADLEMRGPGDILGEQQSGLPKLRYASLSDKERVSQAFDLAKKIADFGVDKYPSLKELITYTDDLNSG